MKYPITKMLIIIGSVVATAAVWASLAWGDWHPSDAKASVQQIATPVPTAAPTPAPTPVPTAPPTPTPIVITNVVYVPISAAQTDSGDGRVPAEPVPVPDSALGSSSDVLPVDDPASVQPVVTPPPAPAPTAAPPVITPAPTPIESGGS